MPEATGRLDWDRRRWSQLRTRMGFEGERVRDTIRLLSADPSQVSLFSQMWPEICSEDTTYDAAFAATPYLVDFARRTRTGDSVAYLIVVGLIATHASDSPADLEAAYTMALADGVPLALERLSDCPESVPHAAPQRLTDGLVPHTEIFADSDA